MLGLPTAANINHLARLTQIVGLAATKGWFNAVMLVLGVLINNKRGRDVLWMYGLKFVDGDRGSLGDCCDMSMI